MTAVGSLIQFIVDVLSLGSLYALLALGLVLIYGILRLVNFAFGELIMVVGYSLFLMNESPVPWLVMALVALVAAVVTSLMTEAVAFRPVRTQSLTAMLITSFAVSTLLQNLALLFISPRPKLVPIPALFSESIWIGDVLIPVRNLISIAVCLLTLWVFTLVMRRTILGIALRAAADKFVMTRMLGVPANLVISAAFAISGLLAGVVGLFWLGRIGSVTPTIGLEPLLVAFIATVIGGMRSLTGAVLGGYVFALITLGFNLFLPQSLLDFRQAFIFTLVILILLFRPEGLIRSR